MHEVEREPVCHFSQLGLIFLQSDLRCLRKGFRPICPLPSPEMIDLLIDLVNWHRFCNCISGRGRCGRAGEPFGTLVLAIAVTVIEVARNRASRLFRFVCISRRAELDARDRGQAAAG